MKNTKPLTIPLAAAISGIMLVASIISQYFIYQNVEAQSISSVEGKVSSVDAKVTRICDSYLDAISRIDQNMQNIAKHLNVPTVKGTYNPNLCNE